MKTILIRLFTFIMLMVFSVGASADVKVLYGEKGTAKFEGTGGKIEVTQKESDDKTQVTVYLTVTPDKGYRLAVNGLEVYTVAPADISQTRTVKASTKLDIKSEDFKDEASKRTYTATIDSKLALWVKVAQFISESKADPKRSDDYSGTYYIGSVGYKEANTTTNYYLCPTEGWCYYQATDNFTGTDNGMPFLTTYQCRDGVYDVRKAIWVVDKYDSEYYTIKRAYDGKYIVFNGQIKTTSNSDRMRMHVEALSAVNDNALFKFVYNSTTKAYNIKPKNSADDRYWTTNGGNKLSLKGESGKTGGPSGFGNTAGIIGIYTISDNNNSYFLEEAIVPPTFTINSDGSVELSSLEGTSIRYTTDGTTPTAGSTEYTAAIQVSSTMTSIKAISIRTSDNKASDAITLPLHTYTYYIVNKSGDIAIKQIVKLAEGKALGSMADIPADIRSPYLIGEAVTFYSFDEEFTSAEQLTDEVKISTTPQDDANIYVTYTTDNLSEKFLKLRGARAFNFVTNDGYAYDNGGTLAYDNVEANKTQLSHLWNISGGDPYAVQIDNLGTGKYLVSPTMPTLSLAATATNNFILMEESAATDAGFESVKLMKATGTENLVVTKAVFQASPVNITTKYNLIDKAGKLIQGEIESESSELGLPDEWRSPLVSEYHYYKTSGYDETTQTYTPADPITSPFDADGGKIYVTYDVSDAVDLTGSKTYLLKFSGGEYFHQEDGHDGINKEGYTDYGVTSATKAIYPYNNGDFNLYVYGQEQWESQLASGASTRTRWLWKFVSANTDPYHVRVMSHQNHVVKDKDLNDNTKEVNFGPGCSYLQTYKPSGYASVITNIAYENGTYSTAYPEKMSTPIVNGQPTEYMILGTSLQNMTLKTFNEVEGERRTVNSFEQYWKNNPIVMTLAGVANPAADNATLTEMGWHQFTAWAYSAPWNSNTKGLAEGKHWYQTISMGSGNFTVEEVSLTPQVILLDQHGWEIMRTPLTDVTTLRKYDSPMVEQYHWYPTAEKVSGYHKYRVSNQEITVYDSDRKATSGRFIHNSNTLAYTPYDYFETIKDENGWVTQDDRVKSDFYVTYTVKSEYADAYTGAATSDATIPSAYLLKQGGSYASTNGSAITATTAPASMEDIPNVMQWNLRPNFDIDREMGYKYAGEAGAKDGAKSKETTDQDNYDERRNGFDPYNVQIQSAAYPLRYFTANTTGIALEGGAWKGTSTEVNLLNLSSKQTADGYDQTKLNITNATFMVVDDGAGNMRLMPRFDNSKVVTFSSSTSTPFKTLETQTTAATTGDKGTGTQTLWLELVPKATEVHFSSEMTDMNGHYLLAEDFTFDEGFTSLGTSDQPFRGIIDGQLNTLSGTTSVPLVAYADGAIIRNVILEEVGIEIEEEGNVGAFVNNAGGFTRIYNCGILGGTVKGKAYTGGLVGLLDGTSRVINCYSYADITGGTHVGGIVGYNNKTTTASSINTMVMNCMFYGDITGGNTVSPVFGGNNIANLQGGLNTFNYYAYDKLKTKPISDNKYNSALAVEEKYLNRFEFYRLLLNSNKKLAAFYATGNVANADQMAKWVLETADRTIDNPKPYPILKAQGYYPSIVNPDFENAPDSAFVGRNKGGKLGNKTLSVTINQANNAPTGANITTGSLSLQRTDKDFDRFNYNYDKVQLPYYNDVGTGNYTENKVVTGWKITAITEVPNDPYTSANYPTTGITDFPNHNYADRKSSNKDLYSVSGRVFSQGAYFDVPYGVTSITIEPYWGKACYIADEYYDVVYKADYSGKQGVSQTGTQVTVGTTKFYGQDVQKSIEPALNYIANSLGGLGSTVYDNALVLVGNLHLNVVPLNGDRPFTMMSVDADHDNEPDYSLIYHHIKRTNITPIRFDFLAVPGTAQAQKPNNASLVCNFTIFKTRGWFEVTNTAFMYSSQIEYENGDLGNNVTKIDAPLILLGGIFDQFVSTQSSKVNGKTIYIHVGSNVWINSFGLGTHSDGGESTPHVPVSVTGGEYEGFYLTGTYKADAAVREDNAECYISGGYFHEAAGASLEQIDGNVHWQIYNADIDEFFGGGINDAKPITGDIEVDIFNSYVTTYCGGPKFGNMQPGKTVTTNAEGCTFGKYFGAGFGGTSLSSKKYYDQTSPAWGTTLQGYFTTDRGKYFDGITTNSRDGGTGNNQYGKKGPGVATDFDYESFVWSDGQTGGRFFVKFASFSLAQCNDVESILTNCTINGNFYGGGSLGKVVGTVTSELDGCTVKGNVFGAGYSASIPTLKVRDAGFTQVPKYNSSSGMFEPGTFSGTTEFTWRNISNAQEDGTTLELTTNGKIKNGTSGSNLTKNYIYTDIDLSKSNLGSVAGNVNLTIKGNSLIGTEGDATKGNVYGGGESSYVTGDHTVTVNLQGKTEVLGNVFGGGDSGVVEGSTVVNIE